MFNLACVVGGFTFAIGIIRGSMTSSCFGLLCCLNVNGLLRLAGFFCLGLLEVCVLRIEGLVGTGVRKVEMRDGRLGRIVLVNTT